MKKIVSVRHFVIALVGIVFIATPLQAAIVVPSSASYDGWVFVDINNTLFNGPLTQLFDEDEVSSVTLRSTNPLNVDPTGRTITFQLGGDFDLNQMLYLGDENLGIAQGIHDYTLEFFDDTVSVGTFSDSFANTVAWQSDTFSPVTADMVTLTLDSVFAGGRQFGARGREIRFATTSVPEPSSAMGLSALGLMMLGRRGRRRRRCCVS